MKYLVKDEKLELKYVPNNGAWTYHIEIPSSKHIVGKMGSLKVSGTIDDFEIESRNLFTRKGQDKLMAVNKEIRNAINKSGGDSVNVTLRLISAMEQLSEMKILETFKDSDVLQKFQDLSENEKTEILKDIFSRKSQDDQVTAIVRHIDLLSSRK